MKTIYLCTFFSIFTFVFSLITGVPELISEAKAQSNEEAWCDPITRTSYAEFQRLMTKSRGMPDAEIVASNIALNPNGRPVYYALVCSKK